MEILKETTMDDELIAKLAVAFTHLQMAPYTSWNFDGDPAQMAAYVVRCARKQGNVGFLRESMGIKFRNVSSS